MSTKNIYKMFSHLKKSATVTYFKNVSEISIMDPVSCVVRLALLIYMPLNTKISFDNNKINFQEPALLQGAVRWLNGAGRVDLHNLYHPLQKFRNWSSSSFGKDDDLDILKDKSSKGLMKLRDSYSETDRSICHSIDLYNQMLIKEINDNDSIQICEKENSLYNEIKLFWSSMEINIVCNIIREMEETTDSYKIIGYIKSIQNILSIKDKMLEDLINKTLS